MARSVLLRAIVPLALLCVCSSASLVESYFAYFYCLAMNLIKDKDPLYAVVYQHMLLSPGINRSTASRLLVY